MYGRPYDDATSFPAWLRELLPLVDGERKWEVINAGGISYASYRLAALMEELNRYEPDLYIIYTGHNEFLEERTYKPLREQPAVLRRSAAVLARTRTFALLHRGLIGHDAEDTADDRRAVLPGEVEALLDSHSGPVAYHRDDALREQILEHLELNLHRMIHLARAAGARVVLVKPSSNLRDCTPFKSENDQALELADWRDLVQRGRKLQRADKLDEALQALRQAEQIDSRHASLQYRIAKVLDQLDRHDEALVAYERARDEDICPLRATGRITRMIAEVANQRDVALVDFDAMARKTSASEHGHPAPGGELFRDHVHLRIETNRMLAVALVEKMIVEKMIRKGIVADWTCPADVVDTARQQIMSRVDPAAHARALRNLAKVLHWAGKRSEAWPLAVEAIQTLPDDLDSLLFAAQYEKQSGNLKQAVVYYQRALPKLPQSARIHLYLADSLAELGDDLAAIEHYDKALRIDPDNAAAQNGLAAARSRQKQGVRE